MRYQDTARVEHRFLARGARLLSCGKNPDKAEHSGFKYLSFTQIGTSHLDTRENEMKNHGNAPSRTTKILSLEQIAWWRLKDDMEKKDTWEEVWAELPPLQRGFVWNANQIERLWDSIARGFPIGSITLQEHSSTPDITPNMHGPADSEPPTNSPPHNYFLLDGQQRAASIALGFKNMWRDNSCVEGDWQALWIDIASRPKDERDFLFRLTNTAHPWGYSRAMNAGEPPSKVTAKEMRDAHAAFKAIYNAGSKKPHELPAHIAFPWQAEAPVPVAFILEILREQNGCKDIEAFSHDLLQKMQEIPMWKWIRDQDGEWNGVDDPLIIAAKKAVGEKINKIESILHDPINKGAAVFTGLARGLQDALEKTEVPAPVLAVRGKTADPLIQMSNNQGNEGEDKYDPAFNLFERINTAGTPLTKEEINYSMLKSAWGKEANAMVQTINTLLEKRQITHPARLVSLLSRLLLSIEDSKSGLRDVLSISQFRRAIKDSSLDTNLTDFCRRREATGAESILSDVWILLAGENEYSLPPILAADITQHNEDLMLLLMVWVYRLQRTNGTRNINLEDDVRRQTLGFITAIHWFSPNAKDCAKVLGRALFSCDESLLEHFFNSDRFLVITEYAHQNKRLMRPIPDVDWVSRFLHSQDGIEPDASNIWALYFSKPQHNIDDLLNEIGLPDTAGGNTDLVLKTIRTICNDKRIVIYAQRKFIKKVFWWFDPTRAAQITDHNVPWDFDHILPQSWVGNKRIYPDVPLSTRVWIHSNGNSRVWPAECNRSKGDSRMLEDELPEYDLNTREALYEASFFKNSNDWSVLLEAGDNLWENDKLFIERLFKEFDAAAINRTVDLYREWYETLFLGNLLKKPTL